MAFKFSREDKARVEEYVAKAHDWLGRMADAENVYNEALKREAAKLNAVIEKYNEFRNEVHAFIEDCHSVMSDEWMEKSERWQESDKGSATAEWLECINNFILMEPVDLIEIEHSDLFEHDSFYDELSELPLEPV